MKRNTMTGFTLIEVLITLLIAVILTYFTLATFSKGHQTALNQDEVASMDASLANISSSLRIAISNAGFGYREEPQYAIRTFDNVPNVLPNTASFSLATNGTPRAPLGATFLVKAMANTDAIMLTAAQEDCEHLTIKNDPAPPVVIPGTMTGTFTLYACLPQTRCNASLPQSGESTAGNFSWDRTAMFRQNDRALHLINQTVTAIPQDASVSIAVTSARVTNDPGSPGLAGCAGQPFIEIIGTADGLQIGRSWAVADTNLLVAHLVRSTFYYLGEDRNLYGIPSNYTFSGGSQADRIVGTNIDGFQLQYFMYNDTARVAHPGGEDNDGTYAVGNPIVDSNGDSLEDSEDIRQVDLALAARSERFDRDYKGKTFNLMNDATAYPADGYIRRVVRENILAKNLQLFNIQRCQAPGCSH